MTDNEYYEWIDRLYDECEYEYKKEKELEKLNKLMLDKKCKCSIEILMTQGCKCGGK